MIYIWLREAVLTCWSYEEPDAPWPGNLAAFFLWQKERWPFRTFPSVQSVVFSVGLGCRWFPACVPVMMVPPLSSPSAEIWVTLEAWQRLNCYRVSKWRSLEGTQKPTLSHPRTSIFTGGEQRAWGVQGLRQVWDVDPMRCGVVCYCELFITTFLVVLITEAGVYFK